MTVRVLFAGMNGAGKSTLACSVYRALASWTYDVRLHEIDVWSDTHGPILGRKPWSARNKRGNDIRNYLADEFAAAVERFVSDDRHELVIGDLHGRWQMPDRRFWTGLSADYAVLVARHPTPEDRHVMCRQYPEDWERFLRKLGIPVAFRVCSLRSGQLPQPGQINVTDLDRELHCGDPNIWDVACEVAELLPV